MSLICYPSSGTEISFHNTHRYFLDNAVRNLLYNYPTTRAAQPNTSTQDDSKWNHTSLLQCGESRVEENVTTHILYDLTTIEGLKNKENIILDSKKALKRKRIAKHVSNSENRASSAVTSKRLKLNPTLTKDEHRSEMDSSLLVIDKYAKNAKYIKDFNKHAFDIYEITYKRHEIYIMLNRLSGKKFRKTEFLNVILHSLNEMGYSESVNALSKEANIPLYSPETCNFHKAILEGHWDIAINLISDAYGISHNSKKHSIAQIYIREQEYLEYLEIGDLHNAINILQSHIRVLITDLIVNSTSFSGTSNSDIPNTKKEKNSETMMEIEHEKDVSLKTSRASDSLIDSSYLDSLSSLLCYSVNESSTSTSRSKISSNRNTSSISTRSINDESFTKMNGNSNGYVYGTKDIGPSNNTVGLTTNAAASFTRSAVRRPSRSNTTAKMSHDTVVNVTNNTFSSSDNNDNMNKSTNPDLKYTNKFLQQLNICYDWDGVHGDSRKDLIAKIESLGSISMCVPRGRLTHLVAMGLKQQLESCSLQHPYRHNDNTNIYNREENIWIPSLYENYGCDSKFEMEDAGVLKYGHSDEIWCIEYSHDGMCLASGSKDFTVIIWNCSSESTTFTTFNNNNNNNNINTLDYPQICVFTHAGPVTQVSWSSDNTCLLTLCEDEENQHSVVTMWNVKEQCQVATMSAESEQIRAVRWVPLQPDNNTIIVTSLQHPSIYVKNIMSGEQSYCYDEEEYLFSDAVISDNGEFIVAATFDLEIVQIYYKQTDHDPILIGKENGDIISIALSKDNSQVFAQLRDNSKHIWDITGRKMVGLLSHPGSMRDNRFLTRIQAGGASGTVLACGNEDGSIDLWNTTTTELLTTLEGHVGCVNDVSWNPRNLNTFASASDDGSIRFWKNAVIDSNNTDSATNIRVETVVSESSSLPAISSSGNTST